MALLSCGVLTEITIDQIGTKITNDEVVNPAQIASVNKDKHELYPGSGDLIPPVYLWLLKMRTSDGGCVIWRYNTEAARDLDYDRMLTA